MLLNLDNIGLDIEPDLTFHQTLTLYKMYQFSKKLFIVKNNVHFNCVYRIFNWLNINSHD